MDTHAILWFLSGDKRIPPQSRKIISNPNNRCFISMASLWEMAIKVKIGKLDLLVDLKEFVFHLKKNNIEIIPLAFEHILETMDLEDHHRDPFDRIILAQAKFENMTIISKDENFYKYIHIKLMW
ncbi:type II toxin-antitoxin system VapC family toxin [Cyclobacterium sp.]|uniref:type II toxin-antitoxin system VapC family toxin n=1 Tax=Cyclobacterium sp. TaxID=1966343 RepID=UPI0019C05802|nr:type II toxin-antitoxin system VapC family toxin [Cyclobacterium sp.]MBD3630448.1 type II toxin-antitoxin system VapC family toxin [Cyclobacterium sp.]